MNVQRNQPMNVTLTPPAPTPKDHINVSVIMIWLEMEKIVQVGMSLMNRVLN